jgi:hypothetical protein
VQGCRLSDFTSDKEVKQALAMAAQALANYRKLQTRKIGALSHIKTIHDDLRDLCRRMDGEIADRRKKLFEPKSLPDTIRFEARCATASIGRVGSGPSRSRTLAAQPLPKVGAFEATFRADVELETRELAGIRADAAGCEAMETFKPRLVL